MKTTKKLLQLLLILACSSAFAQEKAAESQEEAAWMKYMTPGAMHANLAKSNGMWMEELTMWMGPGVPEVKSKATAMNKMIMGGRYQQSMHRGTINEMPFEGMGIVGYDNIKEKFLSTWIDNMGTGIMYMEGTWNEAEKSIEFTGTAVDAMSGKELPVREVYKIIDDNTHEMDMYMTGVDGKEFKSLNIKMTKKSTEKGEEMGKDGTPATGKPAVTPPAKMQPKKPAPPVKGEKK